MTLCLSLFPGIGLLDMAFELEDFCVVRGPDVLWGGDIRRFHPPRGAFAGIFGGPPCQSFSSLVHLVRANGHEPRFGNLIPEFERCVGEALPDWFLMENVPAAPEPKVEGYGVYSFLLDNSALDGGDGHGLEQRRVRRFSFGTRGREAPNLMRWIDLAVFMLPDAERTCMSWPVNNSQERKEAVRCGNGTATHDDMENVNRWSKERRRQAVLSDPSAVPVKIGGSGKIKRTVRHETVNGSHGHAPSARDKGKTGRYRLADACRLQGLPEDFLSNAPFTADGKLKAVANGVPLPMGRAIAKAVKEAILL